MRTFKVTVNGISYDVSVEELGASLSAAAPTPPASSPSVPAAKPQANVEGTRINAPLPGKIVSVNVKVGDTVRKNDVLAILEAMKMENEVTSPFAGKISSIAVNKGDMVQTGDLLLSITE